MSGDEQANDVRERRVSFTWPWVVGGCLALVALVAVFVVVLGSNDSNGEPSSDGQKSSSSSPPEDLKYRDTGQLDALCDEIDWDAIDDFVDIEEPIAPDEDGQNLRVVREGDSWDTSCFATDTHDYGAYGAFALTGVVISESASGADQSWESVRNFPPLPMGSRKQLDCEPYMDDWEEGDYCRSSENDLYRGVQYIVRDGNLVVVAGMLHARGDAPYEHEIEAVMDEMAGLSADLIEQIREVAASG